MEFLMHRTASRRRTGLALAALAALAAAPAAAQDYRGQKPEDDGPIRALLTAGLLAAITAAEARNAEIAAKAPDEKPPLGDGIPWSSFPDAADRCEAGTPGYMMDEATITVGYHFRSARDADFTDILVLRLVERPYGQKLWRIDDIVYDVGDTLRDALTMAFMPN
jgi:hypothetical protein